MKALIVDDDLILADVVSFTLRRAGFEVLLAHDGATALERFANDAPGIVILDLQLPRMDGLEVCRALRARSKVPIIMLSVRDSDEDIVHGLELGADDYITKPFSPAQLVARVQAVMRRSNEAAVPKQLTFGDLTLKPERHGVENRHQKVTQLTQLEYKLLETLVLNSEQVIPAELLIDRIYGPNGGDKAMLKQLVYRLRRKIETEAESKTVYIEAVPGIGYALMRNPEEH
jgi:DNA-binding response OmpR family regulator